MIDDVQFSAAEVAYDQIEQGDKALLVDGNYEIALGLYEEALKNLRSEEDEQRGVARSMYMISICLSNLSRIEEAIEMSLKVLDEAPQWGCLDSDDYANIYRRLGRLFSSKLNKISSKSDRHIFNGLIESARLYYNNYLEMAKKMDDMLLELDGHNLLATLHYGVKSYNLALVHFNEFVHLAYRCNRLRDVIVGQTFIAHCQAHLGHIEVALQKYNEAFDTSLAWNSGNLLTAHCAYRLGCAYLATKQFVKAIGAFLQHDRIAMSINDLDGRIQCYTRLIDAYQAIKNHTAASEYADLRTSLILQRQLAGDTSSAATPSSNSMCQQSENSFYEGKQHGSLLSPAPSTGQYSNSISRQPTLEAQQPAVKQPPDIAFELASLDGEPRMHNQQNSLSSRIRYIDGDDISSVAGSVVSTGGAPDGPPVLASTFVSVHQSEPDISATGAELQTEWPETPEDKAEQPKEPDFIQQNVAQGHERSTKSAHTTGQQSVQKIPEQSLKSKLNLPSGEKKQSGGGRRRSHAKSIPNDDVDLFDILSRANSRRLDDQRAELKPMRVFATRATTPLVKFGVKYDSAAAAAQVQDPGRRTSMRAAFDTPVNMPSEKSLAQIPLKKMDSTAADEIIGLITKLSSRRLDDQRAVLKPIPRPSQQFPPVSTTDVDAIIEIVPDKSTTGKVYYSSSAAKVEPFRQNTGGHSNNSRSSRAHSARKILHSMFSLSNK